MTTEEAVAALDNLDDGDAEAAHSAADDILLALVDPKVKAAYEALIVRCGWWAYA